MHNLKTEFFDTIDSTNSELLRRLSASSENGSTRELHKTLICAYHQSAGRGRLGRQFYSPQKNGIYFSLCWNVENRQNIDPGFFTANAAVCVARGIEEIYGKKAGIKWVNDIYVENRKVCGILTEGFVNQKTGTISSLVIGIGINICVENLPQDIAQKAGGIISPEEAVSKGFRQKELLDAICTHLETTYDTNSSLIEEYSSRSFILGQEITVTPVIGIDQTSYSATATAFTPDASLIVTLKDGTKRTLSSGEVSLHNTSLS